MMSKQREVNEHEQIDDAPVKEHATWHLGADTIASMQGRDAIQAAEYALAKSDSADGITSAIRYSSEAAARVTIGNNATNLDGFIKEQQLGHQGNYPTYDISSTDEIASVKTHGNFDGQLGKNAVSAYKRDFSRQLGWGRSPDALEQDGRNILAARNAGAPIPKELDGATIEQASIYLRDNSCLRVPDDHVDKVRAELVDDIRKFPNNYFLPENPTEDQVNHVLDRVRGIGLTSSELQQVINRHTQRSRPGYK